VPAGAIPKDGPSAGVTIAAALVSLATGIPLRHDVAMTGEVTLRGRVLPVGGVREKSLAALRSGIRTVVIPRANVPDLKEVPGELARRIDFVPVDRMDEVLEVVLERSLAGSKPRVPRARTTAGRPPAAHAKPKG
jgi:ATP-dependent Lon protease